MCELSCVGEGEAVCVHEFADGERYGEFCEFGWLEFYGAYGYPRLGTFGFGCDDNGDDKEHYHCHVDEVG